MERLYRSFARFSLGSEYQTLLSSITTPHFGIRFCVWRAASRGIKIFKTKKWRDRRAGREPTARARCSAHTRGSLRECPKSRSLHATRLQAHSCCLGAEIAALRRRSRRHSPQFPLRLPLSCHSPRHASSAVLRFHSLLRLLPLSQILRFSSSKTVGGQSSPLWSNAPLTPSIVSPTRRRPRSRNATGSRCNISGA